MPDVVAVGVRRRLKAEEYVAGVLAGNRYILARAITLVESARADDAELAQQVLEGCLATTGHSRRVGISGVPGAGKSTFLEALGVHLTQERGETVAVLSVDPSSPLTGGSILGDKTRMGRLANEERAFIRPSPAGGRLGGVARRTRESLLLCEAAGFANVFIETVGVGQSEIAVRGMVDTFLLLALAGAGDELQGIKRGITEITDIVAVNKADADGSLAAKRARAELELALHFFPRGDDGWRPRVLTCSARTGVGVRDVWAAIEEHQSAMKASGYFEQRREQQRQEWLQELIRDGLEAQFLAQGEVRETLPRLEREVRGGRLSASRAAQQLLKMTKRKE